MTEYAVRRYRGESVPVERSLRRGFDRFLSILGANFLLTLLTFGLIILPLLLIASGAFLVGGSGDPGAAIALLCGGLVALAVGGIVALYLSIGLSLYAPAIMMESKTAGDGLRRSWQITKGHRWSLFGAIFIVGILALIITLAITLPAALLPGPVPTFAAGGDAAWPLGCVVGVLGGGARHLVVPPGGLCGPP